MEIKMRMLALGITQVALIEPLKERGINTSQCELNLAINGRGTQPKHLKVIEGVKAILSEMEASKSVNS